MPPCSKPFLATAPCDDAYGAVTFHDSRVS